jgi:hypothetical protein
MAAWQVEFFVIPKRMLTSVPSPIPVSLLGTLAWWADVELPSDYRARLAATATPVQVAGHDVEIWGSQDSNCIEVSKEAGRPIRVRASIDVRQPDAKFAAGLITFARAAGAALVQADGSVMEPTAGGFGLALRESAAWRYVQGRRLGSSAIDINRSEVD